MSTPEVTPTPQKAERKERKRFQSKSPHSPSANGTPTRPRKKREEQAQSLISELTQLRVTMDELLEHYKLRVGGEIAELIQSITPNGKSHTPSTKVSAALLTELRDNPIKTQKGRAKDLGRLQHLVRRLGEMLPPED